MTVKSHARTGDAFVGRRSELRRLAGALDESRAGHGGVVLLAGEAGIGKTRTIQEFAGSAARSDAEVLVGRCHEGEGTPAYWPWIQMIRVYAQEHEADKLTSNMGSGVADIARVVGDAVKTLPDSPAPPLLEPAQARFRLFDSITTFFKNAARQRPLVLIVDDLHCADTPSLLLLQFLVGESADARLLVIGTYRDADVRPCHPLAQTLAELAREPHFHRLCLHGLSEGNVARLIGMITGVQPSTSLVTWVYRETEGNPFFIGEIVRCLVDAGELAEAGRKCCWPIALPQGVREVIGRRLSQLSKACRRALAIASVVGQEFDLNLLEHLSVLSRERWVEMLAEAMDARIIAEAPGALGRYRFAHTLIRETLLCTDLRMPDRLRLHRRIAEKLERFYHENQESYLIELAYHFFQATPLGDVTKAIDYAVRAAESSLTRLGYEEAVSHYERALQALDLAESPDPHRRCDLLLALGNAQGKAGDADEARQSFSMTAEIARKLGKAEHLAQAALGIGQVRFEYGAVESFLVGPLEEALAALGERDSALRAKLVARLAVALLFSDSAHRAPTLSRRAIDIARRVGDPGGVAYALSARQIIGGPGDVDERFVAARELLSVADDCRDSRISLDPRQPLYEPFAVDVLWCLVPLLELGDIEAVDAEIDAFARTGDELRQPRYLWYTAQLRTMRALLEGRFDDAARLANEALAVGQRLYPQNATQAFFIAMFGLCREQGRLEELEAIIKGLVQRYSRLSAYRCALAFIYSDLGREQQARTEFERLARGDFADLPMDLQWLFDMAELSEVCAFLGDRRRAAVLYRLLLPYAGRNVVVGPGLLVCGSTSHYLGLLAGTLSAWTEAERHFEDAVAWHERMGAQPLLARSQYEYGTMLLARGRPADQAHAVELLARARKTAGRLGMNRLTEKSSPRNLIPDEIPCRDAQAWTHTGVALVSCGGGAGSAPAVSSYGATPPGQHDSTVRIHQPPAHRSGAEERYAESGAERVECRSALSRRQVDESSHANQFRKEGDYWTIVYRGAVCRLKDRVGLQHLSQLLRYPGRELFALDLAGMVRGHQTQLPTSPLSHEQANALGWSAAALGDAGEMVDGKAMAAYRRRLEDLRDQLDTAQTFNDGGRAARLEAEMTFLLRELARAVGLGGHARRAASPAERARVNVTRAIKNAVRSIATYDAVLGEHLIATIRTGTFCVYVPDPQFPVVWQL